MPDNKDPKSNKQQNISTSLRNKITSLSRQLSGIYRDTYSSSMKPKDELDSITSKVEDQISKILSRNNNQDISNISRLYSIASLNTSVNNKDYTNSIVDFFEDSAVTSQLVNAYSQNKWIVELDREIDVVCKYLPKMQQALDIVRDAILTADNYDKDYLTFNSPNISPDEYSVFSQNIEKIKKQYKFYDRADKWCDNTLKYGEQFVYKVPYSKAIGLLLDRKDRLAYGGTSSRVQFRECSIISEGAIGVSMKGDATARQLFNDAKQDLSRSNIRNIKLDIRMDSVLESAILESQSLRSCATIAEQSSVTEAAYNNPESHSTVDGQVFEMPTTKKKKNNSRNSIAADGTVDPNSSNVSKLKLPGTIIKELKRGQVIILNIDEICLGYYYIEFINREEADMMSDTIFTNKTLSSYSYQGASKAADQMTQYSTTDKILRYLAYAIANNLDSKFTNANTDLRKEIYAVLKYNDEINVEAIDTIKVTYLAPADVEHILFNEDTDTHRGISECMAGLIQAKLKACLEIANTIGILTRGQDKRVYYVKQNVEQNIAQTLLNVINQIKKQNFNIMQIENMNSILGITGKYNDYVIPVGPSGDPPVQMEVMQGQEIDPQTELMEKLEESAINPICPYELTSTTTSLDYATQITMSNANFMRKVFKKQSKLEVFLGNIMTSIYNTEHPSDNPIVINCVLPSPITLNFNNLNQIIDMVTQQAQNLSNVEYPDETDPDIQIKRNMFIKNYIHFKLGTYLKQNELEIIKNKTDIEFAKKEKPDEQ